MHCINRWKAELNRGLGLLAVWLMGLEKTEDKRSALDANEESAIQALLVFKQNPICPIRRLIPYAMLFS
jgi:hypothetical protein